MTIGPPIPSGFEFNSPDSALAALISRIKPVDSESIALEQAVGRVLAEPVLADRPSPACDVSAMDGYAILESDLRCGPIPVAGDVAIGVQAPAIPSGSVMRIVTGANVPHGAHAVIRREDCVEHESRIDLTSQSLAAASNGANIRRAGENCASGATIVPAGLLLNPAGIAALACVGAARPVVRRRVRLAILVTGDEVLPTDSTPHPWQLRDSNGPALLSMFSRYAWIDAHPAQQVPDEMDAVVAAIESSLEHADAIICTGGVSMGHRDFVPAALRHVGAEVVFHRLPQKPGKPALGAVTLSGKPIFGLPGNPVSVLVTATRLAAPTLRARAGLSGDPPFTLVKIRNHDSACLNLWWYRPVRLIAPSEVELLPTRSSGDIPSVATSDGFVEVPPGASPEQVVAFYPWGG